MTDEPRGAPMIVAPDADEPQQGALLGGRYRLVRLIGRGGMGSVYEATQEDLRRRVAVKLLDPRLASDPAHIERFRREALSAAKLGHPNIVTVTDFQWTAGEPPFLVMEYLSGESLGTLIERSGALPPARVALIAAQVLDALGAAHAAGMIHRDVKPDNVFLTSMSGVDDVAKVLDFGIAQGSAPDAAQLTASGAMVGTPAYMSPEQTRGVSVDLRADIYAVGALMYHALTGELPFRGPTVPAVIVAIATTPTPSVSATRSDVPHDLSAVVLRAMSKEPSHRFASATEMRAALAPWVSRAAAPQVGPAWPGAAPIDANAATLFGSPQPITPVVVVSTPRDAAMPPPPSHGVAPKAQATSRSGSGCATMVVAMVVGVVAVTAICAAAFVMAARSNAATHLAEMAQEQAGAKHVDGGAELVLDVSNDGISVHTRSNDAGRRVTDAPARTAPPAALSADVAAPRDASASAASTVAAVAPSQDERRYSGSAGRVSGMNFSDCPSCDWTKFRTSIGTHQADINACFSRFAHEGPEHQLQVLTVALSPEGRYDAIAPAAAPGHAAFDACLAEVIRATPLAHSANATPGERFTVSFSGACPTLDCR